jgi:hypothetical protein
MLEEMQKWQEWIITMVSINQNVQMLDYHTAQMMYMV